VPASSSPPQRLELTLRKPRLLWAPKPTVVLDGRGQPAQWGTGTWQIGPSDSATLGVFLFNRLWRYGAAEIEVGHELPSRLVYMAPWLPFLRGRLRAAI
jgi:hypothetical protein